MQIPRQSCARSLQRRCRGSTCGSITDTTSRRRSAPAVSSSVPACCRSTRKPASGCHGTLTSEAHVIFGNLKLLLESAGSSLDRLVQVHALIYDSIEYDVLNRVYRQYVANGPPARTVWTARIEAGFKIQLDVIAAA